MTDSEYRNEAGFSPGANDYISFDDDAKVSRGTGTGAFVQCWIWVEDPKAEELGYTSETDPDAPERTW